jgi:hypothetical protein
LACRSSDYNKVNNYRWQSGDFNSSSNNNNNNNNNNSSNNNIISRSYGDKSGQWQKKTSKAYGSSDYLDLDKKLSSMTNRDIASFMQRASKDKDRFYGEDLMKIVQKLTDLPDSMSMIQLSQLVNSLRIYDDKDEAVVPLIKVFTKKVRRSKVVLDSWAVGNMLYGLQGMRSDCPEVRA